MRVSVVCRALCTTLAASAIAQSTQPPIDPFWIYTTAPSWHHIGSGDQFATAPLNLVLLTPEGQYAELRVSLVRTGRHGTSRLDTSNMIVTRLGQWTRTDDNAVRFTSRPPNPTPLTSKTQLTSPPPLYENSRLEGKAQYRLAAAIVSARQTVMPLADLSDPADLRAAISRAVPTP